MSATFRDTYPEHAKQNAVLTESQTIGEFLDTSKFILAEYREIDGHRELQLVPVNKSIQQVLTEHFGIDLDGIEREKREMLARLRGNRPDPAHRDHSA